MRPTKTVKPAMWRLAQLKDRDATQKCVEGAWIPARPENYKPEYCSLFRRIRYAWQVVIGNTETFIWPEDTAT